MEFSVRAKIHRVGAVEQLVRPVRRIPQKIHGIMLLRIHKQLILRNPMAINCDNKGDEERPVVEGGNPLSNPSSPPNGKNPVDELIAIVESVKNIGEYRKTQRKECTNLVRRLKIFSPILVEIRKLEPSEITDVGLLCLKKMKKAFLSAKKLLKLCHGGNKIYLAMESESMMVRFYKVYESINHALEGLPYEVLRISEEHREQIELLGDQLRRSKRRSDTQDMELTMDLMVALSINDDRNADVASVERLANKLTLHTAEELREETLSIQKLFKERRSLSVESQQNISRVLDKLKSFAGVEENRATDDPVELKALTKSASIAVPHEFLCPITLDIMRDPVIIASGQTYERESILKWLDNNHGTCPKTGQTLAHTSVAPNFALKNLIERWCESNNFEIPKEASPRAETLSTTNDSKILALVQDLSSSKLDKQRGAVEKIRILSKESPENRSLIANAGGIKLLAQLLSYPDSKIQEHAVTTLFNLSIDECNKKLISNEGAIPAIIEILEKGTIGAKENSAAALFSLSMLDENKVKIGSLNGIPPLVDLLGSGTIRGKKDAVTALFNLCLNPCNKIMAIEAGIVPPLIKMLEDKKLDMVNETLSLLLILASCSEGRRELGELSFIETLVSLIRDGTAKNKECAMAVMLELGSNNRNLILAALQYGVYEHVVEVCKNGTERGRRKAEAMLKLTCTAQEIL